MTNINTRSALYLPRALLPRELSRNLYRNCTQRMRQTFHSTRSDVKSLSVAATTYEKTNLGDAFLMGAVEDAVA